MMSQMRAVFREELWNLRKLSLIERFGQQWLSSAGNAPAAYSIPIRSIICYLSLLETSTPEEKLECQYN